MPKVCATFMNKNTQYFGTVCGLHKIWGHQMLKNKPTKPRWHMLSTNSRTHSLPWNISGNQKQTLPLNTVMAFTWKEMHSYWEVWASVSAEEGCLLWGSSVCFYPVPVVSAPFEQASVGIFTWTQRDSASKIYSMEKCNVTINKLVNTKDILDLTKWLRLSTQLPDTALGQPFLSKQPPGRRGMVRLTRLPVLFFPTRFYTFLLGV